MKGLIVFILLVGVGYAVWAAAQPQNLGYAQFDNPTQLYSRTKAQLGALVPDAVGQIAYCNNCTQTPVCVSTGTAQGQWAAVSVSTAVTNGFGICQ